MESSRSVNLLTTVAKLPINYQIQYIKVKGDASPLDLTVKQLIESQQQPDKMLISPLKKRYREISAQIEAIEVLSPLKKRYRAEEEEATVVGDELVVQKPNKIELTPLKAARSTSVNRKSSKQQSKPTREPKKSKAMRKLKFDEEKSSPVSGTIIRTLEELDDNVLESGDIDPEYNVVEVTEEAKQELAAIQK